MHVQLSPKHSQRHHFVCLFLCCAFIFLGWFFLFSTNGRTRRQHNYPWETDAHLAITNRLWRRAGCRSWYTGAIYILTADLRGSSKLCTSYSYCWQFVEAEIWITLLGYCYLTKPWSLKFVHTGTIQGEISLSLQSKRLFSSTTVWKHQFFSAQPS